jgi:acyl-coenzyme A thioesterase PaaI-like protein
MWKVKDTVKKISGVMKKLQTLEHPKSGFDGALWPRYARLVTEAHSLYNDREDLLLWEFEVEDWMRDPHRPVNTGTLATLVDCTTAIHAAAKTDFGYRSNSIEMATKFPVFENDSALERFRKLERLLILTSLEAAGEKFMYTTCKIFTDDCQRDLIAHGTHTIAVFEPMEFWNKI